MLGLVNRAPAPVAATPAPAAIRLIIRNGLNRFQGLGARLRVANTPGANGRRNPNTRTSNAHHGRLRRVDFRRVHL